MKIYKQIFLCILLISCKSVEVEFDNSQKNYIAPKEEFLKQFTAREDKYSILMFTQGFENEKMTVNNCTEIIYDDFLKTSETLPVAKAFKFDNTCNTVMKSGNDFSYEIKSELAAKYKFIYVKKDWNKKKGYPLWLVKSNSVSPKIGLLKNRIFLFSCEVSCC
jgi:hypothetical protein